MLTVIMECKDNETELALTLSALVSGSVQGLVSDVIILDHASTDGTIALSDEAGCRLYPQWNLKDVLTTIRGQWVLILEPGARLQSGWIEELFEYIPLNLGAARFQPSRHYNSSWIKRLFKKTKPLERGLLISKNAALSHVDDIQALEALAKRFKTRELRSEIIPAQFAS